MVLIGIYNIVQKQRKGDALDNLMHTGLLKKKIQVGVTDDCTESHA